MLRFYEEFDEFITSVDAGVDVQRTANDTEFSKLINSLDSDNSLTKQYFIDSIQRMLKTFQDDSMTKQMKLSMNIYQVLSLFLISIHSYCGSQFFKEYFYLLYCFIEALNENGRLFIPKKADTQVSAAANSKTFCHNKTVFVVCEMLNLFIVEMFPSYFNQLIGKHKLEFFYLGYEDNQIKNLVLMCKQLSSWLFNNEFIEYRMEVNIDG